MKRLFCKKEKSLWKTYIRVTLGLTIPLQLRCITRCMLNSRLQWDAMLHIVKKLMWLLRLLRIGAGDLNVVKIGGMPAILLPTVGLIDPTSITIFRKTQALSYQKSRKDKNKNACGLMAENRHTHPRK